MQATTTIGLDIAKSVFQVHGIDAEDNVTLRRRVKRRYVLAFFQKLPPCLVGIEACASSHYWSRELQALGHGVRLMPPAEREALRKATQERCLVDARGDLRGGHQAEHAVRRDQDAGATKLPHAASYPSLVHPSADLGDQRHPRPSCRVRDRRAGRTPWCRTTARHRLQMQVIDGCRCCPWRAAALGAQLRMLKAEISAVRSHDQGLAPIQ